MSSASSPSTSFERLVFTEDELEEIEAAAKAAKMPIHEWIYSRLKRCLEEEKKLSPDGAGDPA